MLLTAIELAYLYTDAHAAALRLYRLSLAGHLKVKDEPVRLINAAIKRSARSVRAAQFGAGAQQSVVTDCYADVLGVTGGSAALAAD